MSDRTIIALSEAETLLFEALNKNGVPDDASRSVAKALVAAEAEGQPGHGFSRIADYVAQAKSGKVRSDATPSFEPIGPSAAIVDAGNGFAYPAMELAIEKLCVMANQNGSAVVSIINSHHCGALSLQVEKIADAGLVGLMVANTPSAIAPWGGKTPLFGTNPIAFSAPRADGPALVIDLSLSQVARGKVMNAKKTGKDIPLGWALDKDGNPTTDPKAALAGSMVPIGDAKGTALALMVEVLAAVLGGAQLSSQMSSYFAADGPPPASGQFLLALKPGNLSAFANRLEVLLEEISNTEGARLPGSRRLAAREAAKENGLSVPNTYLEDVRKLADIS